MRLEILLEFKDVFKILPGRVHLLILQFDGLLQVLQSTRLRRHFRPYEFLPFLYSFRQDRVHLAFEFAQVRGQLRRLLSRIAYQVLTDAVDEILLLCFLDKHLQSILIRHKIRRKVLFCFSLCENMAGKIYCAFKCLVELLILEGT